MTQQYILLPIITDPADETRCSPSCEQTEPLKGHWCDVFGAIHGRVRHPDCLSATTAAREMEARAVERGFDMATVVTPYAQQRMRAELARIRGGVR